MAISGIGGSLGNAAYNNRYPSEPHTKTADAENSNAVPARQAAADQQAKAQPTAGQNQPAKQSAQDFYSYLQKNYDCVKNGNVAISGVYLNECANNPQKAKELCENLSYFQKGYEDGLRNAQANARALGARLLDYSESWNIDSKGNVTVIASSTVTSGSDGKGWQQLTEKRKEERAEKQAEKRREERKSEQKKQAEERLEKNKRSNSSTAPAASAKHKAFDMQI